MIFEDGCVIITLEPKKDGFFTTRNECYKRGKLHGRFGQPAVVNNITGECEWYKEGIKVTKEMSQRFDLEEVRKKIGLFLFDPIPDVHLLIAFAWNRI